MLRNQPIVRRLQIMAVVMLVAIAIVAQLGLQEIHARLIQERRDQCRMLVKGAMSHLESLHGQVAAGLMSQGEAQRKAIETIATLSSSHDYLWVNDLTPRVVWHPTTALNGADVSDYADPDGLLLFREFLSRTQATGNAYVAYQWPKPGGGGAPQPKISYVERFLPWGWVVGSGVYVDDIDRVYRESMRRFGLFALAAGLAASALIWALGSSITRPLAAVTGCMRRLAGGEEIPVPEADRADEIGDLTRALAVFRARLIEREEARQAREQAMREAQTVFEHISEAVLVTDENNVIKLVNPSFTRITGFEPEDVIGKKPSALSSGRHDKAFYAAMWHSLHRTGEWHGEIWNRTKTGELYPEALSIAAVKDPAGRLMGYIGTFLDITDRKRREARMRWRAEHDTLTSLFNRAQFEARLADALRLAQHDQTSVAVLYVDLDGFKPINDTLGHAAGDKVLRRVAKRLRGLVRGNDVVARLGGDEFAIIVSASTCDVLARIAAGVVSALAAPIRLDENTVSVGASVGVACYPQHARSLDDLVAAADGAMYRAKLQGRGRFEVAPPLPSRDATADSDGDANTG